MVLVLVLASIGVAMSVMSFESARQQYEDRLLADFQSDVDRRVFSVEQNLSQVVERLRSVSAFFLSSGQVGPREFGDFTAAYLRQQHGLAMIGWAPAEFSDEALDAPFDHDNPTAGAQLPLTLIEPGPVGVLDFDYDLASDQALRMAVANSFRRGYVHYVTTDTNLFFVSPTLDAVDWSGVIVAALPLDTLHSWLGIENWGAAFAVVEQTTGKTIVAQGTLPTEGYVYETGLAVDGELWVVRAAPVQLAGVPLVAWVLLGAGLAITGLLAFLIVTLATSADAARRLVLQRTQELELAESEARNQAARLADEVSHTSQVIATIPSMLISINVSGIVTEWNAAVATMSGIASDKALGASLDSLTGGKCEKVTSAFRQCIDTRETVQLEQLRFPGHDDEEFTVNLTLTPIFDVENELKGCLIVGNDVTERNSMEVQLREAQRLEAVGRLAAGIAHEVNTPAQFVSDNTSFLKEAFDDLLGLEDEYTRIFAGLGERLQDDEKQAIEQARENADREYLLEEVPQALAQSMDGIRRIADIVRAMKEFSHPGGGSYREQADLNRLIGNAITVASNEWKYHATVETDFDDDLPPVLCYPRELNQVVLNLLINGAHAIADSVGESGTRGSIRIATRRHDEHVEIRVSDSGTGIPEAVRDKIFEPFFTTKEVGRGSGQGLALAYSAVVEQHHGDLSFETEIGVGTTFIVKLPLAPQEVAA